MYIAGGNYGEWIWNKVHNNTSGLWTTYAAKDVNNPPIFRRLHITGSSDAGVVDQVVRNGYLIFDGIRYVMSNPTQPELVSPYAFYSQYLSHIKLKNSYIEAGRNWRTSDHTIRGTCVNIRGSETQAHNIEVSDCNLCGSNDGLILYMIDGGLFNRLKIHNMSNDCMAPANISNTVISNSEFYDAQGILGDKYFVDANNTVSGTFEVGETITQTNPTYGTVTATLKAIYADGYYFMDITNKAIANGGFQAGYQITGQTSSATLTPIAVNDGYHSDLLQLWYSPSTGGSYGANVTIRGNIFHDGTQGLFVEGHNAVSNLIVENNLWYGSFIVHAFTIHDSTKSATVRNNTICQTGNTADLNLYGNQPTAVFNVHNNIFCRMWNVPNDFGQTLHESNNIAAQFLFGNQVPARDATDYSYGKNYTTLSSGEQAALFRDPANNDFRLKEDSRAINFGNAAHASSTDILGNPRRSRPDAGCYEYTPTYFPLSITKCTVTAGSKPNSDKISISGSMDAVANDFNDVNAFDVSIDSNNIVYPCDQNFPISSKTFKIKNGKYNYSGTDDGTKKSFTYDVKTGKFTFAAANADLSGLGCLVSVGIEIGDYIGAAEVNETIVNGPKVLIPILLMMGVKDILRVDKCMVKQNNKKPNSDQLSVKGAFAVEDTDANMVSKDLVATLGIQQFTVPANKLKAGNGKFTCSKADVNEGGTAAATFNFNLCSFILTIKDVNIPPVSDGVDFGVAFADYNEVDQVTFP